MSDRDSHPHLRSIIIIGHLSGFNHGVRLLWQHGGYGDNQFVRYHKTRDCEFSSTLACCVFKEIIRAPLLVLRWSALPSENNSNLLILVTVAASTLYIWDYILTFRMEVDLVWKSKWTFMKGLFLFQRYLPFIDTVWLVLYRQPSAFYIYLN